MQYRLISVRCGLSAACGPMGRGDDGATVRSDGATVWSAGAAVPGAVVRGPTAVPARVSGECPRARGRAAPRT